jgi:short subunit dehydrogenase-like uncharacterized protein
VTSRARAPILLHGATGFTGRLVARELLRRGVPFAVSGRDREKLAQVAEENGSREVCVFATGDEAAVREAVTGRALVAACAGPFARIGEPVVRACAEAGVHYVDTTGEQSFVARIHRELSATAKESGACLAPAMAYEIAPSDWAGHLAAEAVGFAPDELALVYIPTVAAAPGGLRAMTSAGTRKSALGAMGSADSWQWLEGKLVFEPSAEIVRSFTTLGPHAGTVKAMSFCSPEAFVTPAHTGARSLRTFFATDAVTAELAHLTRHLTPKLARLAERLGPRLEKMLTSGVAGPEGEARSAPFLVHAEAVRGAVFARVTLAGSDPYGFTARAIAYAAECALRGEIRARGLVAPSVAFPPAAALAPEAGLGLIVTTDVVNPAS